MKVDFFSGNPTVGDVTQRLLEGSAPFGVKLGGFSPPPSAATVVLYVYPPDGGYTIYAVAFYERTVNDEVNDAIRHIPMVR